MACEGRGPCRSSGIFGLVQRGSPGVKASVAGIFRRGTDRDGHVLGAKPPGSSGFHPRLPDDRIHCMTTDGLRGARPMPIECPRDGMGLDPSLRAQGPCRSSGIFGLVQRESPGVKASVAGIFRRGTDRDGHVLGAKPPGSSGFHPRLPDDRIHCMTTNGLRGARPMPIERRRKPRAARMAQRGFLRASAGRMPERVSARWHGPRPEPAPARLPYRGTIQTLRNFVGLPWSWRKSGPAPVSSSRFFTCRRWSVTPWR
jgi:hypothetical protein